MYSAGEIQKTRVISREIFITPNVISTKSRKSCHLACAGNIYGESRFWCGNHVRRDKFVEITISREFFEFPQHYSGIEFQGQITRLILDWLCNQTRKLKRKFKNTLNFLNSFPADKNLEFSQKNFSCQPLISFTFDVNGIFYFVC